MSGFKISFVYFLFIRIFSSYHEKGTGRYTSSLRSCRPSCLPHLDGKIPFRAFPYCTIHLDEGILFSAFTNSTISELEGLLHTIPVMLNVKQESCEYQFSCHWFDQTRNRTPEFTNSEIDTLSTWPSDQ